MRAPSPKLAAPLPPTPAPPPAPVSALQQPARRATSALALALFLFYAASIFCTASIAQTTPQAAPTLTIHMLNGRTGKPMRNNSLRAEFQGSPVKSTITIDKQGIGHLEVPPNATAVSLIAAPRKGHPEQPAYKVCGPFGQLLPIADILAHGFVPQNACNSDLNLTAQPGEVLYLIELLPWYTPATE